MVIRGEVLDRLEAAAAAAAKRSRNPTSWKMKLRLAANFGTVASVAGLAG